MLVCKRGSELMGERERERERDGVSVDHVKKKECCIVSTCRWKVNLCLI